MALEGRARLVLISLYTIVLYSSRIALADDASAVKDTIDLVGKPAPTLSVDRWLKGEPVEAFETGIVYVVEFWGTWCAPCIQNIPHLSALQDEYDDNELVVIGAATHEFDEFEVLERFMEQRGDEMRYRVAFDDDLSMESDWQTGGDASIRFKMPEVYVVDGSGTVTWSGHPEYREAFLGAVETAVEQAQSTR